MSRGPRQEDNRGLYFATLTSKLLNTKELSSFIAAGEKKKKKSPGMHVCLALQWPCMVQGGGVKKKKGVC